MPLLLYYHLFCDRCGCEFIGYASSPRMIVEIATRDGWLKVDEDVLCPDCVAEGNNKESKDVVPSV